MNQSALNELRVAMRDVQQVFITSLPLFEDTDQSQVSSPPERRNLGIFHSVLLPLII